jgi:hypothetical protein
MCRATKCRSTDEVEGKRCKAFCYSGKVVLSIKDYKDKQKAELKRVKLLKGNNFWVIDHRQKGEFYLDDKVTIIPGIGLKIQERLEAQGIFTVCALSALSNNAIKSLSQKTERNMSKNVLQKLCESSKKSQGVIQPADLIMDHRLAENPYLSLYGEEW